MTLNQVVSFVLEDVLVTLGSAPQQVVDATVTLDYAELEGAVQTDVIPIGDFVEDFLNNYNEPDFIEEVSANLTESLLTDASLGLGPLVDTLSVELKAEPGVVPFSFSSDTTGVPSGEADQVVSFVLEDVLVPLGSAPQQVVDATVTLDYAELEGAVQTDVIPIGDFVEDFLNNYNEPDFIEEVSANLTESLLTDASLGLGPLVDTLSVELKAEPGVVPFSFSSDTTGTLM